MERQRLDDRHREFVDLRAVVDGVVGLPQNEVGEVLEGSAHLDVFILGTGLERHQPTGERRVGGCLEDDRHLRHRPRHLAVDGRQPGRKRPGLEDQVTTEVRPAGVDEDCITIAPWHHDLLTGLRIPIDPRDRERQRRRHRLELDPVDEIGSPAAEVISDADDILAVLRHLESQVGVGPAGIIIRGNGSSIGAEDTEERVEPTADPPREAFDLEHLPLGGGEPEAVDVAIGADDPVEGERRFAGGRLGRSVVGLDLEEVAEGRDAERNRGGTDAVGISGKERQDVSRQRHGHFLDESAGGITQKRHRHRLPRLAPGRVDGRGTGERADVEAVAAVAVAGVARLADLDVVGPLLGGDEAQHAVLLCHR